MRAWFERFSAFGYSLRGKSNAKHRATAKKIDLSYLGKHRRTSRTKKFFATLALTSTAATPLIFFFVQPANAYTVGSSFNLTDPNAAGFGVYIDAPQVQNSYVNTDPTTANSTQLETFNTASTPTQLSGGVTQGPCPTSIAGGAVTSDCTVWGGAANPDLGASSTSGDPAFGGIGSQFASANPVGTVIQFATSQKYLGLWWAAGSPGNQIDFYSQGVLISSISTSDLDSLLGAPPTSTSADSSFLTAIDGNTYKKNYYYGNPRGYNSVPPTSTLYGTNFVPSETYSYIHAFANGATAFDKVVLSGNGFEFDNFVTSTATNLQPIGRLVPYSFFAAERIVQFDKNALNATGSMSPQTGLAPANLTGNGFQRPGYVFLEWNTASDGSGTTYFPGAQYSFSSDMTLYAQWKVWDGRPIIQGLDIRVNEANYQYSRPDAPHGLSIDWRGLGIVNGDENWFICDSPKISPTNYFLNAFPSDCVPYPYSAQVPVGDSVFPIALLQKSKYVAYGLWAQNTSGATFAIQSAPNPVDLSIQGLSSNGPLSRTTFTITGNPTTTSSGWYRCENPFVDDVTMPSGTCTSVNSDALTYSATIDDLGKYMVYKVEAEVAGTTLYARKIVSGGSAVAPAPQNQSGSSGSNSPAPAVSPSPGSSGSPSPSASAPKPASSPSVAPPSGPAAPPKNSVSPAQAPSTTETPVTPAPQITPSEAPTQEPQPAPAPTQTEAPAAQINAAALLGGVLAVLPESVQQIFVAESNPAIGATGDDSAAPQPFEALATPASAQAFTENIGHVFTMVAGTALAGIAAAAASAAASAASASAAAASSASAASSSTSTSSSGSKSSGSDSAPGSVGISHDSFTSRRRRWGDELRIWKSRLMTAIDKISVNFVLKSAPISPLVARLFNDGSYLRAMFGTLTVVGPLAAMTLAVEGSILSNGMIANSTWVLLLIISALGSFDVLAGAFAMLAYAVFFWITNTHIDVLHDIRMLLGTALVVVGPAMAMTAFRSIRRKSARRFSEWWERFVDLAVGPFMAGWTASTFVSTLPAIAGVTLAVANHILLFALVAAGCAFIRVLAEEFAARNFPARLNALTPDAIPEPSMVQKYISLVIRYAFWVFMLMGVMEESWQLWIGSALIVLPSVLSWYKHKIPNSPTLWRVMPTGVPALAFGLLLTSWTTSALTALSVSAAFLAKWAFVILPLPLVAFGILALFARHGEDPWEVKPAKRNQFVYRVGGILMLAITMRLAGIV